MKAILLAGGHGTRLYPATKILSKHLLCVFDKPMIYYPLSTLMLAGIQDILLISTRRDLPMYEELLGTGRELGINISYKEQLKPGGLPEAFLIGEDFIEDQNVCLTLGDNLFYGNDLIQKLDYGVQMVEAHLSGAHIWGLRVGDPSRYGVLHFRNGDKDFRIVEKPANAPSDYAVPGIYFFDNTVVKRAKELKPSARGELEIADLINKYAEDGFATVDTAGRGLAWLDLGTFDSLLDAAQFVQTIQHRTGLRIADLDEIARYMGYVGDTNGEESENATTGR